MKLLAALLVVLLTFFSGISAEGPSGLVAEDVLSEQIPALEETTLRSETQRDGITPDVEDVDQSVNEDKEQSFLQALFSLKSKEEQQKLFALIEQYKQMDAEETLRKGVAQSISSSNIEE